MSGRKLPVSKSKCIDGFPVPPPFSEDNFRSAVQYKPRPDDLFIVTYPKCGTTWVQHILLLLFRQGRALDSPDDIYDYSPFLEKRGAKSAYRMKQPGAIKTHLPFHLTPWSPYNKYIYVARNPMDCCVSFFHHTSRYKNYFSGTFDDYFEMFLEGLVDYGDYFEHLLGWYSHRNDPNVFFVTYEALKEDFESNVLKMASFIDDEKYAEPIRKQPEIMENIKKFSSFEFVKEAHNKIEKEDKFEDEKSETPIDEKENTFCKDNHRHPNISRRRKHAEFFRKGIVGDWKNYFSEEQLRRLKEKFTEKTEGTDLMKLWAKYL